MTQHYPLISLRAPAQAVVPSPVMDIRARTNRESQAYFKDQRLISGSRRVEALGLVEGALVIKHRPGKGELPWPVDGPVPCQVVPAGQAAHGQVAGGHVHLLQLDAACARRHRHHRVVGCGERRGGTNVLAAGTHTQLAHLSQLAWKAVRFRRHTAVLTRQVTPFSPGKTSSDFNIPPTMRPVIRVTLRYFNSWNSSLRLKARKSKFPLEKWRTH